MAKLSANGRELLRLEFVTCRRAYMESGWLLENYGTGWHRYAKLKDGVDPVAHSKGAVEARARFDARRPAFAEYRRALVKAAPLEFRMQLHTAISHCPGDADGIYTTVGEDARLGWDEVKELCDLWDKAEAEREALEAAKAEVVCN